MIVKSGASIRMTSPRAMPVKVPAFANMLVPDVRAYLARQAAFLV
jgi:hypothetical protein